MDSQLLGFLNLNKPSGMTSHDAVNRVRRLTKMKHTGHGGTLDPMAQGVLPIGIGAACRLLRYLSGGKLYKAEILLGRRTTTDDTEGEIIPREKPAEIGDELAIKEALQKFVGDIDQVPPMYSAVHFEGKRLYSLARQGAVIEAIPARRVHVASIDLLSFARNETDGEATATVRIDCGSGTYIRSIARDLGEMLGCGACLSGLVREKSGPFSIVDAIDLAQLEQAVSSNNWQQHLFAPELVIGKTAEFPSIEVDETLGRRISVGQKIDAATLPAEFPDYRHASPDLRLLVTTGDWLISVCKFDADVLRSEVVINRATAEINRTIALRIVFIMEAVLLLIATIWSQISQIELAPSLVFRAQDFAIGAGAGVVLSILSSLLYLIMRKMPAEICRSFIELMNQLAQNVFRDFTVFDVLVTAVVSGFCEEVFFRGIMQHQFGLLGASVMFGVVHGPESPIYMIWAGLAGAFLGWLYIWSHNLWLPITTHAVNNFLGLLILRYIGRKTPV